MELFRKIGRWRSSSEKTDKVININTPEKLIEFMGYRIGELLGEGSYGKVYKAQYREVKLAVKVMEGRETESDNEDIEYFKKNFLHREIDALSKLKHEHISTIYKIFNDPKKIYVFMEDVRGGTLLDKVTTSGCISEDKARYYFEQILDALIYLHELKLSHRDLKLENILIDTQDKVKLIDFGFCRITVSRDGYGILSNTACGSTPYMPPEVLSSQPYNPLLCDTWGLGVVLFTMVTGKFPFANDGDLTKQEEKQRSKIWNLPPIFKRSKELLDIIDRMLEPDITKRWGIHKLKKHPWITKEEFVDAKD